MSKMKQLVKVLLSVAIMLQFTVIEAVSADYENGDNLKICSYNIRGDKPVDGPSQWIFRKDSLCKIIRENNFDIVCLQEAVKPQLEDILDRLNYSYVGIKGLFNPILFNAERFELLHTEMFWLSESMEPCSVGWDGKYDRYCTWAKFKKRKNGTVFYVFNTHLDHRGENAKKEGAALICNQVSQLVKNEPVFICGDMNTKDTAPAYEVFTKMFKDSRRIATKTVGPEGTAHNFGKVEPVRIDYIFINEFINVNSYTVDDIEYGGGFYPSDHYPVFIDATIKNK